MHFHLRMACVRARCPHFVSCSLHVPLDIATRFNVEHPAGMLLVVKVEVLYRLLLEYSWIPGNQTESSENVIHFVISFHLLFCCVEDSGDGHQETSVVNF